MKIWWLQIFYYTDSYKPKLCIKTVALVRLRHLGNQNPEDDWVDNSNCNPRIHRWVKIILNLSFPVLFSWKKRTKGLPKLCIEKIYRNWKYPYCIVWVQDWRKIWVKHRLTPLHKTNSFHWKARDSNKILCVGFVHLVLHTIFFLGQFLMERNGGGWVEQQLVSKPSFW